MYLATVHIKLRCSAESVVFKLMRQCLAYLFLHFRFKIAANFKITVLQERTSLNVAPLLHLDVLMKKNISAKFGAFNPNGNYSCTYPPHYMTLAAIPTSVRTLETRTIATHVRL